MHISSPGYTGMAPVGMNSVNVVLVVEDRHVKGQELDAFYQTVVLGNERRRSLLAGARLKEQVRSVGSLVTASRELRISVGGDARFVHIILDGDGLLSGVNVEQR